MSIRTLITTTILLLAPLAIGTTSADAPTVWVEMGAETYSAAETLTGAAPVALITVFDDAGEPLAGVEVRVVFIRQVQFLGSVANETLIATTGADGTVSVAAPHISGAPGSYLVAAFALGTVGSDRYTVGA